MFLGWSDVYPDQFSGGGLGCEAAYGGKGKSTMDNKGKN